MSDSKVIATRSEYRAEHIGPRYNGYLHFAFTFSMSLGLIFWCALRLEAVNPWEWLAVPITFLYANFAEWAGHRFVMHRPKKGFGLVYRRHTLQHHHFFTDTHMQIDSIRDFKVVLFPPVLVSFFLFCFFLPMGLLIQALFSTNVALLFTATGIGYFLNYELLHLSYHLPAGHWVHRIPGMKALAKLHTTHHNHRIMAHKNFNISYPITDWITRTWQR